MMKEFHDRQIKIMKFLVKMEDKISAVPSVSRNIDVKKISSSEELDEMENLLDDEQAKKAVVRFYYYKPSICFSYTGYVLHIFNIVYNLRFNNCNVSVALNIKRL